MKLFKSLLPPNYNANYSNTIKNIENLVEIYIINKIPILRVGNNDNSLLDINFTNTCIDNMFSLESQITILDYLI